MCVNVIVKILMEKLTTVTVDVFILYDKTANYMKQEAVDQITS